MKLLICFLALVGFTQCHCKRVGLALLLSIIGTTLANAQARQLPCEDKRGVVFKDCLKIETKGSILRLSGGVGSGDTKRVNRYLASGISEIHLASPGGDSREGMKLGLLFRENESYVKIIDDDSCASACTVAFLGGKIRAIEDDGDYLVHIFSAYMNGFDRLNNFNFTLDRAPGFIWKDELLKQPKAFLIAVNMQQHDIILRGQNIDFKENLSTRYRDDKSTKVARRFSYLKNMIKSSNARLNIDRIYTDAERITKQLQTKRMQSFQHYINNQLDRDIAMIKFGGRSAAHQIAMRMERDAAFNLIAGICEINEQATTSSFLATTLEPIDRADKLFELCKTTRFDENISSENRLGERSNYALRMIITMFESRINGTSKLSQETLFNYGFKNVK